MNQTPTRPGTVVITGGARGIGRATAERLTRAGRVVALGDRDGELAAQVAAEIAASSNGTCYGGDLDVTDAGSWRDFLSRIAHLGPVEALVNNAGIMPLGAIVEEHDDVTRAIVDVNLHGVIHGTKAVGPAMIARGGGHIVNVASAVGRVASPHGATYSASKFAVVGFSEATRGELAPHGIDVSLVMPTVVLTELAAGVPPARGVKPVTADDVARAIESVLDRPRPETWVPRWGKTLARSADLMPRAVRDALARALKADSVLADADPAARAAYEERARS
ncbi:SDR family oxidoreductase [Nocardioides sp. R-C-SC26]|uniref:SDR family oxidoreductase n=1 Tax=Nocardioides sp. R-C-SC26 TaxID=2870414 RepID=UPI001E44E99E|nr:SDR family oxidoreductase [Nocardioides sp. R-C-SC26]